MRKFLIAGNWKMNLGREESLKLARALVHTVPADVAAQVAVIPALVHLKTVADAINGSPILLGAQNVSSEKKGAFTGEVSAAMLKEFGVKFVLVGHSERRHILGETDAFLNKKVHAVVNDGLIAILCVGELLEERQKNLTNDVVARQLDLGLAGLAPAAIEKGHLVIAYEPVWAIGTGQTASKEQAQEVHAFIRARLAARFSPQLAGTVRIQYGGSAKKSNAQELLAQPDIDGLLVGGASLLAEEFAGIVQAAAGAKPGH